MAYIQKQLAAMVCFCNFGNPGNPYCRFDLYEIDGKIMFGEMTFTPQGCVLEFYQDDWLKQVLREIEK